MSQVTVVGGGAWGTTLSILVAEKGHSVTQWVYEHDLALAMERERENRKFLPGISIPPEIRVSNKLEPLAEGAEYVLVSVPANFLRSVVTRLLPALSRRTLLCSVTKGIEENSGKTASAVLEELGGHGIRGRLAILSGPNLAREIAQKLPAATVVASRRRSTAESFQRLLMMDRFRVYTSGDMVGVEWSGVLKNVIAIAAGISDGLKLGQNAKAALITRGLAEMTRLGTALGARRETFFGLSGLGDLLCTCNSPLSRNFQVGEALARGKSLPEVLATIPGVPEGVNSARTVTRIARRKKVEMPICEQVVAVLFEKKDPLRAITDLMRRKARAE